MDNQYYYKLMASYLSKRNCDESFMRYFLGKSAAKKTPEELERADERKRRLQRERSRRYRALKNARRQTEGAKASDGEAGRPRARPPEEGSDADEPPTLCPWRERCDGASDDGEPRAPPEPPLGLRELLSSPDADLDYPTVHSLMFHWLQT